MDEKLLLLELFKIQQHKYSVYGNEDKYIVEYKKGINLDKFPKSFNNKHIVYREIK